MDPLAQQPHQPVSSAGSSAAAAQPVHSQGPAALQPQAGPALAKASDVKAPLAKPPASFKDKALKWVSDHKWHIGLGIATVGVLLMVGATMMASGGLAVLLLGALLIVGGGATSVAIALINKALSSKPGAVPDPTLQAANRGIGTRVRDLFMDSLVTLRNIAEGVESRMPETFRRRAT